MQQHLLQCFLGSFQSTCRRRLSTSVWIDTTKKPGNFMCGMLCHACWLKQWSVTWCQVSLNQWKVWKTKCDSPMQPWWRFRSLGLHQVNVLAEEHSLLKKFLEQWGPIVPSGKTIPLSLKISEVWASSMPSTAHETSWRLNPHAARSLLSP